MHDNGLLVGGGSVDSSLWKYRTDIQVFNSTMDKFVDTGFSLATEMRSMQVFKIPASVLS